jgi:hypothetical protein
MLSFIFGRNSYLQNKSKVFGNFVTEKSHVIKFGKGIVWATFWAIFSPKHPVTLERSQLPKRRLFLDLFDLIAKLDEHFDVPTLIVNPIHSLH